MIRYRPPFARQVWTAVDRLRTIGQHRSHGAHHCTAMAFFVMVGCSLVTSSPVVAEDSASPTLLAEIVNQRADQLAQIDSDERAVTMFAASVGPALGLKDAAGALAAKRLPSKMVKELGLAGLSQSVSELMAALAAWQVADSIRRDAGSAIAGSLSATRQDWLRSRSRITSLSDLVRLAQEDQKLRTSQTVSSVRNTDLLLAAERMAFESSQRATAAWWDIYGWRERIRQAKGQARLCGTWQWIVHNHQIHGEQKSTIMFPPPGQVSAQAATPTEVIILGDAIYLRWEHNGQIQEDSLLFIKDDAKIEGSFVNNTGGWGPITAKRTAPCQP